MTRVPVHALCSTVAALAILSVACGGSGPQQASPIGPTQTAPPAAPDPPGTVMPLEGVAVSLGGHTITTGSSGWFRFDFGCPNEFGYNTTLIYASKTGYSDYAACGR